MKALAIVVLGYLIAINVGVPFFGIPGLNFIISLAVTPLAAAISLWDLIKVYGIAFLAAYVAHFHEILANLGLAMPFIQSSFAQLTAEYPPIAPFLNQMLASVPAIYLMLMVPVAIVEGAFAACVIKVLAFTVPKRIRIRQVGY
jgi:ABC-type Co2+ transport system permease subunit